MKKLLLSFGAVATVVAPVAVVVSCNKDKDEAKINSDLATKTNKDHLDMWTKIEWKDQDQFTAQVQTGVATADAAKSVETFVNDVKKINEAVDWTKVDATNATAKADVKATLDKLTPEFIKANPAQAGVATNVAYQTLLPVVSLMADSKTAQDFLIKVLKDHTSGGLTVTDEASFNAYKAAANATIKTKTDILTNDIKTIIDGLITTK